MASEGRGGEEGRLDGGSSQIEAALLAERRIARDDGFPDPAPRHFTSDDFFGVGQRSRELSTQSNEQRTEVFEVPRRCRRRDQKP